MLNRKTIDIILKSSQPIIIAGGGIKNTNGHQEVINLAKILNIPIVSSAGHGDVIPFGESLYAGQMGPRGNPVASKLVREADVILALGTRLGFNSTFFSYENINQQASIIQVEIEPTALGRYFPISIGIYADAKTVADVIAAAIDADVIAGPVYPIRKPPRRPRQPISDEFVLPKSLGLLPQD